MILLKKLEDLEEESLDEAEELEESLEEELDEELEEDIDIRQCNSDFIQVIHEEINCESLLLNFMRISLRNFPVKFLNALKNW